MCYIKILLAGKGLTIAVYNKACPVSLFKYSLSSLTLSQLVSNERAVCTILSLRLDDHHGGEGCDKAVLQRHIQGLG